MKETIALNTYKYTYNDFEYLVMLWADNKISGQHTPILYNLIVVYLQLYSAGAPPCSQ